MQIEEEYLICRRCIHNDPEETGCKAFPDGIPLEHIIKKGHSTLITGQEADYLFTENSPSNTSPTFTA
jgi:hypothetical protein